MNNDNNLKTMMPFCCRIPAVKCQQHCICKLYPTLRIDPRGGGHLYVKLDIILVKKNDVIRVVFQDQAMYAHPLFRGAKTCKIGKMGVFLVILTNS